MEAFLDLLRIVVPAALVFVTAWVLLERQVAKKAPAEEDSDLSVEREKILLPLRIKAYERLVIMLERLQPGSLIFRHNQPSHSSARMQIELLQAIREEYEHNMSLRIYVSENAWKVITAARDEVSQLVKLAGEMTGPESTAMDLSRKLLEIDGEREGGAVKAALHFIDREARGIMTP